MHILIIAQRVPFPPNKGEKLRTFHQLEFLVKQGHTITVAAPYVSEDELKYFDSLQKQFCKNVLKQQLANKYLALTKGLLKQQSLSVANFYHPNLQVKIDGALTSEKFDVVMCSASSVAEYVFQSKTLAKLTSKPTLIMDFMDLDSDKWLQYAQQTKGPIKLIYKREYKILNQYEKSIADTFDHCFFITDTEVQLFKQSHPDVTNVIAIENGIDKTLFNPPSIPRKIETPKFLFAGVMDYPPNIDAVTWFVENLWQDILTKWPEAEFCIAGMNPTEKIKAYTQHSGISVTGFVEDIKPYFDNANIFVAPFRIARGVQNKVLQAMACELPVVASSMGAEGIRCQDDQDILLADSPNKFFEQINRLINDKNTYEQISKNGLNTIQSYYSWDSILLPLNQLITSSKTDLLNKEKAQNG